jgi:hypothetical protein
MWKYALIIQNDSLKNYILTSFYTSLVFAAFSPLHVGYKLRLYLQQHYFSISLGVICAKRTNRENISSKTSEGIF